MSLLKSDPIRGRLFLSSTNFNLIYLKDIYLICKLYYIKIGYLKKLVLDLFYSFDEFNDFLFFFFHQLLTFSFQI